MKSWSSPEKLWADAICRPQRNLHGAAICLLAGKIMGTYYMSPLARDIAEHTFARTKVPMSDHREEEEPESLFDGFTLDVLLNMESPPAEVFETSWIRAKELLDAAGPHGAILLLTITESGDDLASSVVLSSGSQQLPTNYILEILDAHLEALGEE